MTLAMGRTFSGLLTILALLAAWRIVSVAFADGPAGAAPQQFIWQTTSPAPVGGSHEQTRAQSLQVLSQEPLRGDAFAGLARTAVDRGDSDALQAQRRALRHAPRDAHSRAWLIDHHLVQGEYPQALEHVDVWLRLTPHYGQSLFPALADLTGAPAFADALAVHLQGRPGWRGGFMNVLRRHADPAPMDRVYAAMHRQGALDGEEFQAWLDRLMRENRWSEAYARWVGTLDMSGRLPAVHNGGFDARPSGRGFDWRTTRIPGVVLEFPREPGREGFMAHARFLGRAVPRVGLEQPLLLPPGQHVLSARMKAQGLRGSRGLEWTVVCAGQGQPLAVLPLPAGTSDWRTGEVVFEVPVDRCPAVWLRLRNPAQAGSAQLLSGEVWLDDVAIRAMPVERMSQGNPVP